MSHEVAVEVGATDPTIRFDVARADLLRVISDALICAPTPQSPSYSFTPMITQAEFVLHPDGRLAVTCTDRFVMGTALLQLPSPVDDEPVRPDHWSALSAPRVFRVPLPFLRRLPNLIPAGPRKQYGGAGQQVDVTIYPDTFAVGSEDHPDFVTRASVPLSEVAFIDAKKIVDNWRPRRQQELAADVWLDPSLLAKFSRVSPSLSRTGLRFELGDVGQASRVTIGHHFTGLTMPMRVGDRSVAA